MSFCKCCKNILVFFLKCSVHFERRALIKWKWWGLRLKYQITKQKYNVFCCKKISSHSEWKTNVKQSEKITTFSLKLANLKRTVPSHSEFITTQSYCQTNKKHEKMCSAIQSTFLIRVVMKRKSREKLPKNEQQYIIKLHDMHCTSRLQLNNWKITTCNLRIIVALNLSVHSGRELVPTIIGPVKDPYPPFRVDLRKTSFWC